MDVALIVAGIVIGAWLLIILSIDRQLYARAYWWMEAVGIALIVAAVRESFLRIFQGFTRIAGFRWSVWTVIGAVVAYPAWKVTYAPPLQTSRLFAFVFGAEF